jgi:hypothetical protein
MGQWQRPYRATASMLWGWFVFGLSALVAVLAIAGIALGEYARESQPVLGFVAFFSFFAFVQTFILRTVRAGLVFNDEAVRVRHIFRTRTIPWREIAAFDSRPARLPLLDRDTAREAIWISLRDGTALETPVQRSIGLLIFSMKMQKNNGVVLSAEEYGKTLDLLRARHRVRGAPRSRA